MAKQRKQRSKCSSAGLKNSRQSAAKQAVKKRSNGPNRISKDQVADVTAQINSQFSQVQTLYITHVRPLTLSREHILIVPRQSKETPSPAASPAIPEPSVQDLAHVMMDL